MLMARQPGQAAGCISAPPVGEFVSQFNSEKELLSFAPKSTGHFFLFTRAERGAATFWFDPWRAADAFVLPRLDYTHESETWRDAGCGRKR